MSGLAPSTPSANKLEEAIAGANKTNGRLARELDTPPSSSSEGPPPKRLRPAVVYEVKLPEMIRKTEVLEKYIALLESMGGYDAELDVARNKLRLLYEEQID